MNFLHRINESFEKLLEDEEMSNEYDSEGNRLTKAQAEFFKNSKVRDSKGRLLVCYHGTANKYFNYFDSKKLDNSPRKSQIGQGFYFTDSLKDAESYKYKEDIMTGRYIVSEDNYLFSVYLNIINPFYVTKNSKKLDIDELYNLFMDGDNEWFYTNWIPFELNNKEINNILYIREDIEKLSKQDRVKLWLNYHYTIRNYEADKNILSETVRAYKNQELLLNNYKKYFNCDGFIEMGNANQYVVFNSNQIKSITNKNPTNSNNINERWRVSNKKKNR